LEARRIRNICEKKVSEGVVSFCAGGDAWPPRITAGKRFVRDASSRKTWAMAGESWSRIRKISYQRGRVVSHAGGNQFTHPRGSGRGQKNCGAAERNIMARRRVWVSSAEVSYVPIFVSKGDNVRHLLDFADFEVGTMGTVTPQMGRGGGSAYQPGGGGGALGRRKRRGRPPHTTPKHPGRRKAYHYNSRRNKISGQKRVPRWYVVGSFRNRALCPQKKTENGLYCNKKRNGGLYCNCFAGAAGEKKSRHTMPRQEKSNRRPSSGPSQSNRGLGSQVHGRRVPTEGGNKDKLPRSRRPFWNVIATIPRQRGGRRCYLPRGGVAKAAGRARGRMLAAGQNRATP